MKKLQRVAVVAVLAVGLGEGTHALFDRREA
jgi:hypothetical protein